MVNKTCPDCGTPLRVATRQARARRGDRVVYYTAQLLQCDGCATDEDGPHVEITDELRASNNAAAAAAWAEKFGTELPPRKKAGRKSPNPHTEVVTFRLTPELLEVAERLRMKRGASLARLMRMLLKEEAARLEAQDASQVAK